MTSPVPTIGLEVHVQLATATKLFSAAPNAFGGEPNTRVSPVDLGLPGVLPVLNRQALRLALRAALALAAEIRPRTRFVRKNYFYPDLPKGYQISQYREPFCVGGRVPLGDGRYGELERIHLEEDAGKNVHGDAGTLVDLNRAGVPLIEIVGRPDLHSPADAHAFLDQLKRILQYAGVSDCDMEKGSLRCDANISMAPRGAGRLGTKVEIKNLNSFKMVQRALEYEVRRQTAALAAGRQVVQETRLWNEEKGETRSMRTKESAPDYRYFPEPDLPPLDLPAELVTAVRGELPELPLARQARYREAFGLPDYDIGVLTADRAIGDWYERLAALVGDPKIASNWVMTEVLRVLNETGTSIEDFPMAPEDLAGLIRAERDGRVNRNAAGKVFHRMLETGEDADTAIAALGLQKISDPAALQPLIEQALAAQPKAAADFRAGTDKALGALVGAVMRQTRGRADPAVVERLLRERLAGPA